MMKIVCLFLLNFAFVNLFGQMGEMKDPRDNNVYKTVQIGKQIWMAHDLSTKTIEYECLGPRHKDTTLCGKYGTRYFWKIAKSACPIGWHLPSKEEFQELLSNIGGDRKYQFQILVNGEFRAFNYGQKNGHTFWTSSGNGNAIGFNFGFNRVYFSKVSIYDSKTDIRSVRCIKDSVSLAK